MLSRRFAVTGLSAMALSVVSLPAWAQDVHMMELHPAASAVMDGRSSEFFVRFDRPVDHVHSLLTITSGGKVVETLHPRLDSAPDVLFAIAPSLASGNYKLHWSVRTMAGVQATEGDIPFTVKS